MKRLIFLLAVLCSCKQGDSLYNEIQSLHLSRNEVEALASLDVTNQDQYQTLVKYFRKSAELAFTLKSDPKAQQYWADLISGNHLENFCLNYLPSFNRWEALFNTCMVNSHFLCPDELRSFPEILKSVLDHSPKSFYQNLQGDPQCAQWLKACE